MDTNSNSSTSPRQPARILMNSSTSDPARSTALHTDPAVPFRNTLNLLPPRPTNPDSRAFAGDFLATSARRPTGSSSATPPPSTPPGARFSDPSAFHAPRVFRHTLGLLPPRPTEPAALHAAAARYTNRVDLTRVFTQPGDLLAPSGSGASADAMNNAHVLGLRVSESLGLGNNPAHPGSASALEFLRRPYTPSSTHQYYTTPSSPVTGFNHALSAIHTPGDESTSSSSTHPTVYVTPRSSLTGSSHARSAFHTPRGCSPRQLHSATPTSQQEQDTGESSARSAFHPPRGSSSRQPHFATPTSEQSVHELTREQLFQGSPAEVAALLMELEFAGHAIQLLEEGAEETRARLMTIVKLHLHTLMENRCGSEVVGALLRSCKGRPEDLHGLVESFIERNDAAWGRWIVRRAHESDDIWKCSMEILFTAVSHDENLCQLILRCLVRENIACNPRGPELLHMSLRIFGYEQAKYLMKEAVGDMSNSLDQTMFGSIFLRACLSYARTEELIQLEEKILHRAKKIAMGKYSNFLLRHAIKYGTDEFLCSLLCLFHDDKESLAEWVTGRCSRFTILDMLSIGRQRLPATTGGLEELISLLPADVLSHPNAKMVLERMEAE